MNICVHPGCPEPRLDLNKLGEVLVGCANLLDVIKGEWGTEWSDWDQSIRERITTQLLTIYALQEREVAPASPDPPRCEDCEQGRPIWIRGGIAGHEWHGNNLIRCPKVYALLREAQPVSAKPEPTALSKANDALIMLNNYVMSHPKRMDVSWVIKVIGQTRDHIDASQSLSAKTPQAINAKLLEACKLALNAFEKGWAIDWNILQRAIEEAEEK